MIDAPKFKSAEVGIPNFRTHRGQDRWERPCPASLNDITGPTVGGVALSAVRRESRESDRGHGLPRKIANLSLFTILLFNVGSVPRTKYSVFPDEFGAIYLRRCKPTGRQGQAACNASSDVSR